MAAPVEDMSLTEMFQQDVCIIEATVATGFESVARAEAEEKLQVPAKESNKGRVSIECPIEKVDKVLELGCVDHCRVLLHRVPDFGFTDNQHDNLLRIRKLVGDVNWPVGLKVWRKFFSFEYPIADTPENPVLDFGEVTVPPPRQNQQPKKDKKSKFKKWKKKKHEVSVDGSGEQGGNGEKSTAASDKISNDRKENDEAVKESGDTAAVSECDNEAVSASSETASAAKKPRVRENPWDPLKPTFRVTCNRHGDCHNFDSMTAASNMGGAVYRYFGWNVKLTEFDIEVILNIEEQEVSVCIGLTKESLHKRNIKHFGPTTLRPTIAYNMLRLCDIKDGDIVCDPMCGSGSIPIQCAVGWPSTFNICGDIGGRCVMRTSDNIDFMAKNEPKGKQKPLWIDPLRWNVCCLPLRDQSIDVFITDLPFGLRIGTKVDNWRLYPGSLMEMARVVHPGTGRACLLTEDKKCMIKTLQSPVISKYWLRVRTLGINMGGLAAGVFVLSRSKLLFTRETTPAVTPDHSEAEKADTKT